MLFESHDMVYLTGGRKRFTPWGSGRMICRDPNTRSPTTFPLLMQRFETVRSDLETRPLSEMHLQCANLVIRSVSPARALRTAVGASEE